MANFLSELFNPTKYAWERNQARDQAMADEDSEDILSWMGDQSVAGMSFDEATNLEDLMDKPATGLYKNASPEKITHLSQIQSALESGSIRQKAAAVEEYWKYVDPARAPDEGPNSWQEYSLTTGNPTRAGYADWMTQMARSRSGVNFDSSMPNPELAKQFEYVTDGRPLTNETPHQIKTLNEAGTIRYRPDPEAVGYQRAGLAIHTSLDTINTMMKDILPTLKSIPEGLSPVQSAFARGQRWLSGKIDIELMQGVQRQYSTQAPLIAKLLSRNVFQDKGAGSDRDLELAKDFLPVLPGDSISNIGDDPEVMELKLEAINYIVNTLYPRDLGEAESMNSKIADPESFTAKVQAYHDELMTLEGKDLNTASGGDPPPGTVIEVPDGEGNMVKMVITADNKMIRVQ